MKLYSSKRVALDASWCGEVVVVWCANIRRNVMLRTELPMSVFHLYVIITPHKLTKR